MFSVTKSQTAPAVTAVPSTEECQQWVQRVHSVQQRQSPEEWAAAKRRYEESRQHEARFRKCKAAKGHAMRSSALASEGLRQMSVVTASSTSAVQARWSSAQAASKKRSEDRMRQMDASALFAAPEAADQTAQVLEDEDDEEAEAMAEAANLVGGDVGALASLANRAVAAPTAAGGRGSQAMDSNVEAILAALKKEPSDDTECASKFQLYEGYASEVEEMRKTLYNFVEESKPTLPAVVASDMDRQVKRVDSTEALGIPDETREWFVYHMMRKAQGNNGMMAGILDTFEKRLQFLANNNQKECPVCLEDFAESGIHAAETLSCCHKVCKGCWAHWSQVSHGRPFCPLCRHEDFLDALAANMQTP
mmetsp:Transcript_57077/g.105520  ORF Transcript_57077/g.105520 Transcript_57077/m.105520 type:complete len:364 (+) Transcript_57077:78-1169(+)